MKDRKDKRERKAPLYKSFGYAFEGIYNTIRRERNMQIHCAAVVLVILLGCLLRISKAEWITCLILFGMVMGLECVNTAVEAVVDLVTKERRPLAKKAKDCGNYVGNHWRYHLPAEDHGCYNVIVQHSPRDAERLGIIIQ